MDVAILHNPGAGTGSVTGTRLTTAVRLSGHVAHYRSVKDSGWDGVLDESAPDVVLVAGGDGTVRKVCRAVAARGAIDPVVALLPLGVANNVAASLSARLPESPSVHGAGGDALPGGAPPGPEQDLRVGLPSDGVEPAVANLLAGIGPVVHVDLARVEAGRRRGRLLESVGGGPMGDLVAESPEGARAAGSAADPGGDPSSGGGPRPAPGWRHESLEVGRTRLAAAVREVPARHWTVWADGADLSGEYLICEVTNCRSVGPRWALAPAARPDDGYLDLVLVEERWREALVEHLASDGRADRATPPPLPVRRVREVTMRAPEGTPVHLDDRIVPPVGRGRRVAVDVLVDGTTVAVRVPSAGADGGDGRPEEGSSDRRI